MRAALPRRAVLLCVAVVSVLAMLPAQQPPPSPELVPAVDTSAFRPGNIISDAVFYDSGAMSAAQVQTFLTQQGANCTPAGGGPACLKNYRMTTETQAADAYCRGRYAGAAGETAATIIAKVAQACGINPRVLLVMLQKETSLVTRSAPTAKLYDRAMGFGCPDSANGACSSYYPGLFRQLYFAAKQFKRYAANPGNYGHVPGIVNNVLYHPNPACGSSRVLIENKATASLYNYTPYQPNGPALAAGYAASTDSCSSYGNRNFWLYFTDWFGSTQTVGRDVNAPRGTFDAVSGGVATISVRGWTFDPDAPTTGTKVHVYVDGRYSAAIATDQLRPDVAAAFPGAGSWTGFNGTVAADPGRRTVCVYGINTGPGYTNPLLGCRAVTVAPFSPDVPFGALDAVSATARTVTVGGWAVDPNVVAAPVRVHLYVDGRWAGAVTADGARSDVAAASWWAGPRHGYQWTGTLAAGQREICAYAINQGAGTTNPRLGCRTITVGGPPYGDFEEVTTAPGQVRIQGWAIDPDTVDPINVHVYVDGQFKASAVANVDRPDVAASRPGYGGGHGFDVTLPVLGGSRNVCVFGINTLSGSSNSLFGCTTVTVPATTFVPIGNIDAATVTGNTVTLSGWALDQDLPTEAIRVHLWVDGSTWGGETLANLPRADIATAFPGAGPGHGWQRSMTLPSGVHEICAYGINIEGGSTNPQLACTTVTVP